MAVTLTTRVSAAPGNSSIGENNSWVQVDNNQGRPLFAQATYLVNPGDIAGGGGGGSSTVDKEFVTTQYTSLSAFSGTFVGDFLTKTVVYDTSDSSVFDIIWYNETQEFRLGVTPSAASVAGQEITLTDVNGVGLTSTNGDLHVANPLRIVTGTIQNINEAVTQISGFATGVGFEIPAFTSGTLIFEGRANTSGGWYPLEAESIGGSLSVSTILGPFAGGIYSVNAGNLSQARVRVVVGLNIPILVNSAGSLNTQVLKVWSSDPRNFIASSYITDANGNFISSSSLTPSTSALNVTVFGDFNGTKKLFLVDSDGTTNSNITKFSGLSASTSLINGKNRLDVSLSSGHNVGGNINGYGNLVGGSDGTLFRPLKTNTDGTLNAQMLGTLVNTTSTVPLNINAAGALFASNTRDKFRDSFASKNTNNWNYPSEINSQGTSIKSRIDGTVAGESYLVVSLPALSANLSWEALSIPNFSVPYEAEYGMSLSQRIVGQEFNIELVGQDVNGNVITRASPSAIQVNGASVITNVWTVTANNVGVSPGDLFYLTGFADSRANVPVNLVTTVNKVVGGVQTFTFTSTQSSAASFTGTQGFIQKLDLTNGARFQIGTRWWGTTTGNADVVSLNDDPVARVVNWNPGNTQDTAVIPNEGGINYANLNYVQPFRSRGSWHLEHTSKRVLWRARDIETTTTDRSSSLRRMPNPLHDTAVSYALRIRARNLPSFTVPSGYITLANKTASSTAILTVPNHGILNTDSAWVVIYGNRDTANFGNNILPVPVTYIDPNTLALSYGPSATAASGGGFISIVKGSNTAVPSSFITTVVQSFQKTVDGTRLILTGNANWAYTIGDTVTVYGLVDTTSLNSVTPGIAMTGLFGRYRVALQGATVIELEPLDGQDLTSVSTSAVNAGGSVIKNSDLRLNYIRVYDRSRLEIDTSKAGHSIEADPVAVVGSLTIGTMPSTTVTFTNQTVSVSQINGAAFTSVPTGTVNNNTNPALPVYLNQNVPLPMVPQHIYGNITV